MRRNNTLIVSVVAWHQWVWLIPVFSNKMKFLCMKYIRYICLSSAHTQYAQIVVVFGVDISEGVSNFELFLVLLFLICHFIASEVQWVLSVIQPVKTKWKVKTEPNKSLRLEQSGVCIFKPCVWALFLVACFQFPKQQNKTKRTEKKEVDFNWKVNKRLLTSSLSNVHVRLIGWQYFLFRLLRAVCVRWFSQRLSWNVNFACVLFVRRIRWIKK